LGLAGDIDQGEPAGDGVNIMSKASCS